MVATQLSEIVKEKIETVFNKCVLFVIIVDTTGSMSSLKERMVASLEKLRNCIYELQCEVQVQLINMKDYSDFKVDGMYAPRDPRSSRTIYDKMDIEQSLSVIRSFECEGGGDAPEAINQALADAATIVNREATAQQDVYIVFAGDAPGHGWGVNSHLGTYDQFPEDLPNVKDLFATVRSMKDRLSGCFCFLFGSNLSSSKGALPIFKALAETLNGFALWSNGYGEDSGASFDSAVLGALQRGTIKAMCNTQALAALVEDLVRMQFPKDEVVRQVSEEAAYRSLSSGVPLSKTAYPKSLSVVSDIDASFDIPFESIQALFSDPSASLSKLRELMRTRQTQFRSEDHLQDEMSDLSMTSHPFTYRSLSAFASPIAPATPQAVYQLNSSVVKEDATLADAIAALIS